MKRIPLFNPWRLWLVTMLEILCSFGCIAALMMSAAAWAQPVAAPVSTSMMQLAQLLAWAVPVVVAVLLMIRPFVKLGDWLHAKSLDTKISARQKAAFLGAESLARSLDHYLEVGGQDLEDLADPTKRAAALKHLEDSARSGAAPAASEALNAMGAQWLTGTAAATIDLALAKLPPSTATGLKPPAIAPVAAAAGGAA